MYNQQKVGAIIVAAGASRRMDGIDKMWAIIEGKPVLFHTLEVFVHSPFIDQIVVVLGENNIEAGRQRIADLKIAGSVIVCRGGDRRQDSVAAGLSCLEKCDWVVIHDGARPMVPVDLIKKGLDAAQETGAATAAVPVTDTIKVVSADNIVQETLPRQQLRAVQTPQVFRYDVITDSYRRSTGDVTDDAAMVEQAGYKVKVFTGSYNNIKITTPDDLLIAGYLLPKTF